MIDQNFRRSFENSGSHYANSKANSPELLPEVDLHMPVPMPKKPLSRTSLFALSLLIALAAAAVVGEPVRFGPAMSRALFILILATCLWVTNAVPAYAVGILVIALQIFLLGRPGGVYAEGPRDWEEFAVILGHPLIWLFFGGFVLAAGMSKTRLDRKIASRVLVRLGNRPRRILLGVMAITFVFSMFMSNTATTAMMLALLAPLLASLDREDPFVPALLLGVAVAANLGGMGSLIGSPPNAIAVGALARFRGMEINFLQWMILGLPVVLVLAALTYRLIVFLYPARQERIDLSVWDSPSFEAAAETAPPAVADADGGEDDEGAPNVSPSADGGEMPAEAASERAAPKPSIPAWQRRVMIFALGSTVALWLTGQWHGAPTAVVSFLPIVLLTTTGILTVNDIRGLPYDVLFLIAGGLALGQMVTATGLADWLVEGIRLKGAGAFGLGLSLSFLCVILSTLMSNTAAANILIPMGVTLAVGMEAHAAVPIAFGAAAAMCLPVSTPPNALVFATDRVATRDFVRLGLFVGVLVPLVGTAWSVLVLDFILGLA